MQKSFCGKKITVITTIKESLLAVEKSLGKRSESKTITQKNQTCKKFEGENLDFEFLTEGILLKILTTKSLKAKSCSEVIWF